ncbi:hypothetical protein GCM10022419_023140 [Nonomuraea rosea]|uniref:Fasciclin domain-containing protein n=1 Tax=Nonomuraea rosea TaxID=638574 RepID=A0ABP6VZJ6_9ACTN
MTHVRLLKKLAVMAIAGFLALGLGAAAASSASAAVKIDKPTPFADITDELQG